MSRNRKLNIIYLPAFLFAITVSLFSILENNYVKADGESWSGQIFPKSNLQGSPIEIEPSNELDFNWGNDQSPTPGLPANTAFSAIYQRIVNVEAGAYNLIVNVNGGIRVYVDEKLEINRWTDTGKNQNWQQPVNLEPGAHTIRVEYNETAGEAQLSLRLDDLLRDNRWYGVIYPSKDLNGTGILVGNSPQIVDLGFNWGDDQSPAPGLSANTAFSAIYQRKVNVEAGAYNLIANVNGGVRVYVDGNLQINRWNDTGKNQNWQQPIDLPAGTHIIRVEYNETAGEAKLSLRLDDLLRDNRWYGVVYPSKDLKGTGILVGNSPHINDLSFNWGNNQSPAPGLPANTAFSAIYQRKVNVDAGAYNLIANVNGGLRVYVDGKLEIDRWNDTGRNQNWQQPIDLKAGTHTIRVEFNETAGEAKLSLRLDDLLRDNRWYGVVYPSKDLNGKGILVGNSPHITDLDYNWGDDKSPAPELPANTAFSAIYQRKLNVEAGAYNLIVNVNGGARVYVDDKLEVDHWTDTGQDKVLTENINLIAGTHKIRVEYNETAGIAKLSFDLAPSLGKRVEYINSTYSYTFQYMLDKQMSIFPQTDKRYNTYIRSDGLKNVSGNIGYVDGAGWNVRGGPGTNYWVVGGVKDNEKVTIYNKVKASDGSDWYQINYNRTWVNAGPVDVAYYLNPNNFDRNTTSYFQFLKLSESAGLNAIEVNAKLLYGKGVLEGKAQAFINAGIEYNVNEVYLISHALLETGNGNSQLANGIIVNGKTVYNMYGIGAYDSCPSECGAQYAYDHGWTTPEKAIIGGAKFIAEGYINRGQDTLFKMRWNPTSPGTHQYATDIGWAVKQTSRIYSLYEMLDSYTLIFDVPEFGSQPSARSMVFATSSSSVANYNEEEASIKEQEKSEAIAVDNTDSTEPVDNEKDPVENTESETPSKDQELVEDTESQTPSKDQEPVENTDSQTPSKDLEPVEDTESQTPSKDQEPVEDTESQTPSKDQEPVEDTDPKVTSGNEQETAVEENVSVN